jgi:hypothetical protein
LDMKAVGDLLRRRRARPIIRHANAARDARNWSVAVEHYRAALSVVPHRADLWVQYGNMLKESGNRSTAAEAYAKALALAPGVPDTQLQIGHLQKLEGNLDAAASSYAEALKIDHHFSAAEHELRQLGRPEKVHEILSKPSMAPLSPPAKVDDDRIVVVEARVAAIAGQISNFLEHVSATKALALKVAEMQISLETLAHRLVDTEHAIAKITSIGAEALASSGLTPTASITTQATAFAALMMDYRDQMAATKALAFEIARIRVEMGEIAERLSKVEGVATDILDGAGRSLASATVAHPRDGAHVQRGS